MKYKTLVISGGGLKGISYLGCLHEINKIQNLNEFNDFYGTSVGALLCSLIVMGYTPLEIYNFSLELDFRKLVNKKSHSIDSFLNDYGVDDCGKIIFIFKAFIKNKTNNEDITLKELSKLTKKRLFIATTCLSNRKLELINSKNYPDLRLWEAIRMSISIPLIFKPYKYNDKYYIDGAVTNNFLFDKVKCKKKCIGITSTASTFYQRPITNFTSYIYNILFTCTHNQNVNFPKYTKNIIIVDNKNQILEQPLVNNEIKFTLSNIDKTNMFNLGKTTFIKHNKKNNLFIP